MMPTIRPFEERNKTRVYSPQELAMISGQIVQLQNTIEPVFKNILNNITIAEADNLMNGAPN